MVKRLGLAIMSLGVMAIASAATGTTGDSLLNLAGNPGFTGSINNFDASTTIAVPEPGTIISFLSGSSLLAAMMFIRRRRM